MEILPNQTNKDNKWHTIVNIATLEIMAYVEAQYPPHAVFVYLGQRNEGLSILTKIKLVDRKLGQTIEDAGEFDFALGVYDGRSGIYDGRFSRLSANSAPEFDLVALVTEED